MYLVWVDRYPLIIVLCHFYEFCLGVCLIVDVLWLIYNSLSMYGLQLFWYRLGRLSMALVYVW